MAHTHINVLYYTLSGSAYQPPTTAISRTLHIWVKILIKKVKKKIITTSWYRLCTSKRSYLCTSQENMQKNWKCGVHVELVELHWLDCRLLQNVNSKWISCCFNSFWHSAYMYGYGWVNVHVCQQFERISSVSKKSPFCIVLCLRFHDPSSHFLTPCVHVVALASLNSLSPSLLHFLALVPLYTLRCTVWVYTLAAAHWFM